MVSLLEYRAPKMMIEKYCYLITYGNKKSNTIVGKVLLIEVSV